MTMGSAVMALAFTPDGAFIAGGTNRHVFIWKADDVNLPRATWTRGDEVGWRTPQSQVSTVEEDQFTLCWDADGQKLAYGVNSRVRQSLIVREILVNIHSSLSSTSGAENPFPTERLIAPETYGLESILPIPPPS